MTKIKLKNARPKAPWGAIISSAIGGLGQIWGQQKQADLQKQQLAEQRKMYEAQMQNQQMQNNAMTLNNYFGTLQPRDEYMQYPTGGRVRRKLKNAGKANRRLQVTDGGYALPVGNGLYYIPEGATHDMINESGRTGVGMTYGGTPFEVEPNELVAKSGNDAIVFSPKVGPVIDGLNPVQAVLAGYPRNYVAELQEAKKGNISSNNNNGRPKAPFGRNSIYDDPPETRFNNIWAYDRNSDMYNAGEMSTGPTAVGSLRRPILELNKEMFNSVLPASVGLSGQTRRHAVRSGKWKTENDGSYTGLSDWFGGKFKPIDYINGVVQTTLPFFGHLSSRSNLNSIRDMYKDFAANVINGSTGQYTPMAYTSLDTRVRNDAELAALQEEYQNEANISRQNIAGSSNYLNRINELNTQRNLGGNKIFDNTRASNLELRNKDAELRNQFAINNATTKAAYDQAKLNANLDLLKQRADFETSNLSDTRGLWNAVGNAIGGTLDTAKQDLQNSREMTMALSLIPNVEQREDLFKVAPWLRKYWKPYTLNRAKTKL